MELEEAVERLRELASQDTVRPVDLAGLLNRQLIGARRRQQEKQSLQDTIHALEDQAATLRIQIAQQRDYNLRLASYKDASTNSSSAYQQAPSDSDSREGLSSEQAVPAPTFGAGFRTGLVDEEAENVLDAGAITEHGVAQAKGLMILAEKFLAAAPLDLAPIGEAKQIIQQLVEADRREEPLVIPDGNALVAWLVDKGVVKSEQRRGPNGRLMHHLTLW